MDVALRLLACVLPLDGGPGEAGQPPGQLAPRRTSDYRQTDNSWGSGRLNDLSQVTPLVSNPPVWVRLHIQALLTRSGHLRQGAGLKPWQGLRAQSARPSEPCTCSVLRDSPGNKTEEETVGSKNGRRDGSSRIPRVPGKGRWVWNPPESRGDRRPPPQPPASPHPRLTPPLAQESRGLVGRGHYEQVTPAVPTARHPQ